MWEVRWNQDESQGTLTFYSISADGRVSIWLLMKDKLESEELMALKLYSGTGNDCLGGAGGFRFFKNIAGVVPAPNRKNSDRS